MAESSKGSLSQRSSSNSRGPHHHASSSSVRSSRSHLQSGDRDSSFDPEDDAEDVEEDLEADHAEFVDDEMDSLDGEINIQVNSCS